MSITALTRFVTSSNTITGGVCCGIRRRPAAYPASDRDLEGLHNSGWKRPLSDGARRRRREKPCRREGVEFGATTGRSRRCGWFDAVGVRHAVRMNGITGIALTKLDVLTGFKKIPICTAYRYDGKVVHDFPASLKVMQNAQPVYQQMEGWDKPLDDVRKFSDLPAAGSDVCPPT